MNGYTPLFQEIVTSSIWNEDMATRIVWVTMMALADKDGNVQASIAGLAPVARITLKECETAIKILSSPDEYSRSQEEQGRRIIPIEGGWHLVNHKKYRDKAKSRSEYYQNWREQKKKKSPQTPLKEETNSNSNSNSNSETARNSAQQTKCCATNIEFEQEFWPKVPNKIGKGKAREAYLKARKKVSKEIIFSGVEMYQKYEAYRSQQSDYRPLHPSTWLNQERWGDEWKCPEIKQKRTAAEERARLEAEGRL